MKHLFFAILFVSVVTSATAQLPPMIHRITPLDTAVDTTEPLLAVAVPSVNADHGFAFAPNTTGLKLPGSSLFNDVPLRVEMMAKIDDPRPYSILVAHEPKNSPRHWEMFTMVGSGCLTLYLPGNQPDHLHTTLNVADGVWRKLAVEFRDGNAELFADGVSLGSIELNRAKSETPPKTMLAIGSLVEGGLPCRGAIDALRIFGKDNTLLLACDFEPLLPPGGRQPTNARFSTDAQFSTDARLSADAAELSATMQAIVEAHGIHTASLTYAVTGSLAHLSDGRVTLQSNLLDRLFPTSGAPIEPTVKPGEKPSKNIPRLEGGPDDLRKAIAEYGLTTLDPDAFRPGVFANWGEQYIDVRNQIDGTTPLPRGAAEQVYDQHALIDPDEAEPTLVVLRRTEAMLESLRCQHGNLFANALTPLAQLAADVKRLQDGIRNKPVSAIDKSDYFAACALRRQIMFADPLLTEVDRILFLGRACYAGSRLTNPWNTDRMGGHFATQNFGFNTIHGGGIFTIAGWRDKNPTVVNLIEGRTVVAGAEGRLAGRTLDYGSFHSPELDYDGQTVYFAHSGSQEHRWIWSPETSFNLFKMQVDGTDIMQLTDGPHNDFDPCPLPDGRVVFISERRGGFIRCFGEEAWLRVPTYVLHSMKSDGSDIYPISFFETSEWQPSVDNNGMLVYTRWDYVDRENCLGSLFWTCFPDGRDPRAPTGNYPLPWHTLNHHPLSRLTGIDKPLRELDDFDRSKPLSELVDDLEFLIGKKHGDHRFGTCPDAPSALPMTQMHIRAIPDSHRYVLTAAPHHGETFGSLVMLDLREKNDYHMNQMRRITPYVPFPESESPMRGQYHYGAPLPLSEDLFLCNSWEDLVVLDRFGNEELICEREILPIGYDPRLRLTKPFPVRARTVPPIIPRQTTQGEDFVNADPTATIGALNVNFSHLPLPADRPIKRLRVFQVILKPNPWMDQPFIGYATENTPRIPLGTVPVEDDGSVFFEAPPNKQLLFQILDENDMAVQTMRSVTYLHPGERLVCTGCHEPTQISVPNLQAKAFQRPPSTLEPEIGHVEPITFYRTVQPVFEKSCVGCHRELQANSQQAGPVRMDFGDLRPYVFVYAGGMLGATVRSGESGGSRAMPGSVGAANSRLGQVLFDDTHRDVVSAEDRRRIILWLDANAPRLGAFIDEEAQRRGELVLPVLD
ncbi:MAG: hypothetical protein FWE95_03215 [Planctomycetaceae bacterium]|nr:hypothetical protein [Planctomycetaceae bacterium]